MVLVNSESDFVMGDCVTGMPEQWEVLSRFGRAQGELPHAGAARCVGFLLEENAFFWADAEDGMLIDVHGFLCRFF